MRRDPEEFREGVLYGIRLSAQDPTRARRALEWRLHSVTILPDKWWKFVTLSGAIVEMYGSSCSSKPLTFVGFVILLVGIVART